MYADFSSLTIVDNKMLVVVIVVIHKIFVFAEFWQLFSDYIDQDIYIIRLFVSYLIYKYYHILLAAHYVCMLCISDWKPWAR